MVYKENKKKNEEKLLNFGFGNNGEELFKKKKEMMVRVCKIIHAYTHLSIYY